MHHVVKYISGPQRLQAHFIRQASEEGLKRELSDLSFKQTVDPLKFSFIHFSQP